jgi:hypothetical protein
MTETVQLRIIRVPEFDIKVYEITHADGGVEKIMHRDLTPEIGYCLGLDWYWWSSPTQWINYPYGR